jgi:hypothetical protein
MFHVCDGPGMYMHVAMAHMPVSEMVLVCFMCVSEMVLVCFMCVMVLVCTCM